MNILTKFKDLLIETLKENKKMILIFYILFIASFIIAWAISSAGMENVINNIPVSSGTTGNDTVTAAELFIQNERGGIITYIASIFFGIAAVILLIYNGANIGVSGALLSNFMPKGAIQYIVYLIPHGIFEITALVLQSVAGILLFLFIWKFIKTLVKSEENGFKEKVLSSYEENKKIFIQSLVLMVFGTILLLIAAPIEAYVSVPFSEFILGV